jgi:transposase
MLAMHKQSSIQTLHKQGKRNADIARIVGCHRNTVWKAIKRDRIIERQTRRKASELDVHKEQIEKWLEANITRVRIYQKLQEGNRIKSTYANLCEYIKKHVPSVMKAFGVQHTAPGEEAELDFGYLGMLPGIGGKPIKTWGLVLFVELIFRISTLTFRCTSLFKM